MKAALHLDPRSALVGILAAVVLAFGLAAPGSASAGEYTISICQADEAGYVSSAFEQFATRGMKWRRACDPRGDGLRGLITANVPRTGRVEKGAQSGFILNAPPGTSVLPLSLVGRGAPPRLPLRPSALSRSVPAVRRSR